MRGSVALIQLTYGAILVNQLRGVIRHIWAGVNTAPHSPQVWNELATPASPTSGLFPTVAKPVAPVMNIPPPLSPLQVLAAAWMPHTLDPGLGMRSTVSVALHSCSGRVRITPHCSGLGAACSLLSAEVASGA